MGLAVGFGAQNLVRDVITGFFSYTRDNNVGDYVSLAGVSGIVERSGLDHDYPEFSGDVHTIPNGLVKRLPTKAGGCPGPY